MTESAKAPIPMLDVPAGTPPQLCKGAACGATIYWIETAKRGRMPVDCRTEHGGTPPTSSAPGRGIAHWITCPDRARFKAAKKK